MAHNIDHERWRHMCVIMLSINVNLEASSEENRKLDDPWRPKGQPIVNIAICLKQTSPDHSPPATTDGMARSGKERRRGVRICSEHARVYGEACIGSSTSSRKSLCREMKRARRGEANELLSAINRLSEEENMKRIILKMTTISRGAGHREKRKCIRRREEKNALLPRSRA